MTDRFLITPHSTTLTYRIWEGEEITQEIPLYIVFDIISQEIVGIYGSLEEAQLKKAELEEKLKSTLRPRMNNWHLFISIFMLLNFRGIKNSTASFPSGDTYQQPFSFLLYGCLLSIFDIKPFLVLTPSGHSLISSIINEVSSMCVCLKS
jgi:hypothetical protein